MYGKIFSSIYEGTLHENWQALVTLQQMIVLCDQDGVVDMTTRALAARTGIPLDILTAGIEGLEKPDPQSRTPDLEGRRIERLDSHRTWGWRIVNYRKYRMMVDAETVRKQNRVRQQAKRDRDAAERHAESVMKRDNHACHAESRQAEAEAEVKRRSKDIVPSALVNGSAVDQPGAAEKPTLELVKTPNSGIPDCDYQAMVDAFHAACPTLPTVVAINPPRRKHMQARWREVCASDGITLRDDAVKFFRMYFAKVGASWHLTGKGRNKPDTGHPWRATFDWLLLPTNFLKVIEGNYDNDKRKAL